MIRSPTREVRAIVDALRRGGTLEELASHSGAATGSIREVTDAFASLDMLEPESRGRPLAADDAERFDRQLLYLRQHATDLSGRDLQRRLRDARVVVIGCGGLGTWVAWSLATIGVGRLVLVDPDVVDLSNLNRQLLFEAGDVGHQKALTAARRLEAFDPRLDVTARTERIEGPEDVERLVRGADLAVGCADTPPYEIARWIDDGCAAAGVAHLSAGQMPPIVRVGPFVEPGVTPCVRCLELALRRDSPLAEALEQTRRADSQPAATLGPACGLIGALIGLDVLHWLTGLCEPATWGTVLTIDIRTFVTERLAVVRTSECPACGGGCRP